MKMAKPRIDNSFKIEELDNIGAKCKSHTKIECN
jgi:hypothetical protein